MHVLLRCNECGRRAHGLAVDTSYGRVSLKSVARCHAPRGLFRTPLNSDLFSPFKCAGSVVWLEEAVLLCASLLLSLALLWTSAALRNTSGVMVYLLSSFSPAAPNADMEYLEEFLLAGSAVNRVGIPDIWAREISGLLGP